MAAMRSDDGDSPGGTRVERRRGWRRVAAIALAAFLVLLTIAVAGVWIARKPIATEVLEDQFEKRGV